MPKLKPPTMKTQSQFQEINKLQIQNNDLKQKNTSLRTRNKLLLAQVELLQKNKTDRFIIWFNSKIQTLFLSIKRLCQKKSK